MLFEKPTQEKQNKTKLNVRLFGALFSRLMLFHYFTHAQFFGKMKSTLNEGRKLWQMHQNRLFTLIFFNLF